jgi:hypothetical protein
MKIKKLFASIISVIIFCFVMPVMTATAAEASIGSTATEMLKVGSGGALSLGDTELENPVQIGSGRMSFNAGVLTLENVDFTTSAFYGLQIRYPSDITINLVGTNSIASTYSGDTSNGLDSNGAVSFIGTGSLTVRSGNATNASRGIALSETNDSLSVSGCTVTVIGGTGPQTFGIYTQGDITVNNGGRLVVSSGNATGASYAIFSQSNKTISVDNGYLEAAAGNGNPISCGIGNADVMVRNGGSVNISGGSAAGDSSILTDGDGNVTDLDDILSINFTANPEVPEPEDEIDPSVPPHLIPQTPTYYPPAIPTVTPIVEIIENMEVKAFLNKSGSVDSDKTRLEILRAARTKGVTQITLILPENCKGISTKAIQKCLKAAGDKKLFLSYDNVTIRVKADTKQILTDYYTIP